MDINKYLKRSLHLFGIDRAVGFTVLTRVWLAIAGILSILLIARHLSPSEQGFYYSFSSILGLQVFFELGFTYVIMQFASHERAQLTIFEPGILAGECKAKARLSSLLHLILRWYAIISVLFLLVVLPIGIAIFKNVQSEKEVLWRLPWILLVLSTSGNLYLTPLFSFIEGCGYIAEVAKFRFYQSLLTYMFLWTALATKMRLVSVCFFAFTNFLLSSIWLVATKNKLLLAVLKARRKDIAISWNKEVFPFQWKIAISWLSGYFIFQLFTPVVLAYHGAIAAGQMGMTLTIVSGISSMALSWMSTKAPRFGGFVALKQYHELDSLFISTLKKTFINGILCSIGFVMIVYYLKSIHNPIINRLLPLNSTIILVLAMLVNIIVTSEAIYLRSFKKEPFLKVSIISGTLTGLSTLILGRYFGVQEILYAYFTINLLIGLMLGSRVFMKFRKDILKRA